MRADVPCNRHWRRGTSLQTEQVDIFLDACPDGGVAVLGQLLMEERKRLGALAALGQHLGLYFLRRAERQRQVFLCVQLPRPERLQAKRPRLGGVAFGGLELTRRQRAPAQPGQPQDHLRRDAPGLAKLPDQRFGLRKVVRREGAPHVPDQRGLGDSRGGKQQTNDEKAHDRQDSRGPGRPR